MAVSFYEFKKNVLAGAISGVASISICHPFDVVRTQLQLSKSSTNLYAVIKSQSFLHLYKGFTGPFLAQAIYKSILFGTTNLSHKLLFNDTPSYFATFTSGFIAGIVNSFAVCPIELLRTQSIASSHSLSSISKNKSYFRLWQSLLPTMLRDGPGVAIYFLTFQIGKDFGNMLLNNYHDEKRKANVSVSSSTSTSFIIRLISAATAGITYWLVALPFDNVKTNIEHSLNQAHLTTPNSVNRYSSINHIQQVIKSMMTSSSGLFRFYRGIGVAVSRGIPSAAITLTTYDLAMDYMNETMTS